MSQRSTSTIVFRSVRSRMFEDQATAIERGYNSVLELALDELNEALVLLQARMDKLEGEWRNRSLPSQMPYVSLAQARKFHSDKKLRKYAAEYDRATDFSKLPERVRKHKHKHSVLHELHRRTR